MTEHNEPVRLRLDGKSFITELRRNAENIRHAVVDFDARLNADLVNKIDAISGDDPECAHGELDDLLEATFPPVVRDAIQRLRDRCGWWAGA